MRFRGRNRGERLLVLSGHLLGVLAAVRGLADAGFAPLADATTRRSYAALSRATVDAAYLPSPWREPVLYARAVAKLACEKRVAAVLPGTEVGLLTLAANLELFPPGIAVGTCTPDVVRRATDKTAVRSLGAAAGLDLLPTTVGAPDDLSARIDDLPIPAVVKPMHSDMPQPNGSLRHTNVAVVHSRDELASALHTLPGKQLIVEEYAPGPLAAVCGVAWEGRLICAEHQQARRIWPRNAGISAYAETVPRDERLEEGIARMLASVGWSGIFQTQFIRTRDRAYLIDFNPRIYGSLALAIAAGMNLPAIWADLILGREPRVTDYRVGVRYRSELDDVRAIAATLGDGDVRAALSALLPRHRTTHALFALRDPLPTLGALNRAERRRLEA